MATRRKIEGPQEWLYVIIVGALALYLVIGVIAWSWMLLAGIPAPGAFTAILAAIIGALAGVLSPLKWPQGPADGRDAG
jgi:cation transporter-like permease